MSDLRKPDVATVLVTRVDGGVTILRVVTTEYRPATPTDLEQGSGPRVVSWTVDPTPEYIDSIIAKHAWTGPLAPVSWEVVPNDVVNEQTDRTFRNAWKANGKRIEVDMPKAREIHREYLRRLRAPLLEALDTAYLRADEAGNEFEKRRLAQRKQALRDATDDPAIDTASTPDALKAVIPPVLREE